MLKKEIAALEGKEENKANQILDKKEQLKKVMVSQDDFLFGAQSAMIYEEFNVEKTSRHKIKQKRVLVIDGHEIYHLK